MPDNGGTGDGRSDGVSRRRFVRAAGASGIAVGIAGCTGGGDTGGDDSGGPISPEPPEDDVSIQIAADSNFANASEDILTTLRDDGDLPDTVHPSFIAGSFTSGDRRAQYQQILSASQRQPTVMMMDNGWTIPFIARGQIANLSEVAPNSITQKIKNDYLENMVATAQGQNGDIYGVPLFADFPTIQYRKDLMREAGYSDSEFEDWATNPMTWQQFSEIVQEVSEQTDRTGFTWQGASYEGLSCCDFVEFMGSNAGSYFGEFENYFGPVGDRPVTVDNQNVINAVRMMRAFIYGPSDDHAMEGIKKISPEAVVQYTEEPSRTPFTNGDVVAHRNWPYSININGAEEVFGDDLGVMPIPFNVSSEESEYETIGGSTSALGGWHLTLNPNAPPEKKQAAVQLFKSLQNDEVRLRMFEIGGWTPPIPNLIVTDRTRELNIIGRYVETLRVAGENALPRPVTPVWPQESSQIAKQVNASIRQQIPPRQAMTQLKESLESIEGQF